MKSCEKTHVFQPWSTSIIKKILVTFKKLIYLCTVKQILFLMEEFKIENNVLVEYNGDGGDVVIPDSVKEIGSYAFYGCRGLTSINIPDSVEVIGNDAFSDCISLTSVNIPDSVTKICGWAFYCCSGLTAINIPNSVTEIGYSAFSGTRIKRQPQGNITYKGFNADMTCRDFVYKEGKTYICDDAKLCKCGFHACINPLDCFNYYYGDDAVYHEVILEDRTGEIERDSKVCGKKITIGRRLTLKEMAQIFNELNK